MWGFAQLGKVFPDTVNGLQSDRGGHGVMVEVEEEKGRADGGRMKEAGKVVARARVSLLNKGQITTAPVYLV
jgi:hypothetical protein